MTSTPGAAFTFSARPLHILLTDDSAADLALLSEVFAAQDAPVAVQTAPDGLAALDILRDAGRGGAALPDLVLLDLNMPRMSGLEALAAIKDDPALRRLPVVVLTTSDAPEDIRRAYELGAVTYVTKPRTLSETMDLARALLDFWTRHLALPASSPLA